MYFNYLKTQLQHHFALKTHLEELVTCFKTSLFIYTISSNVSHERSNSTQTTNIDAVTVCSYIREFLADIKTKNTIIITFLVIAALLVVQLQ